jgi:hypothetical protein
MPKGMLAKEKWDSGDISSQERLGVIVCEQIQFDLLFYEAYFGF